MQAIPTLIVDDSNMIIKIIKKALLTSTNKDLYFEESSIYTASDGMEAFAMMSKGYNIKFIISDINMPHLNGYEFIEILEDTGKLDSLDVVFITSTSNKQLSSLLENEHILGIIFKPFKVDTFVGLLAKKKIEHAQKKIKREKIRAQQSKQKEFIKQAFVKYYKKYINKDVNTLDSSTLELFIDEIFGDEMIDEDEYAEIMHSIISNYLFKNSIEHCINNKNILCVLSSFDKEVQIAKNRLNLKATFETQIDYVNNNELKKQEILDNLSNQLNEVISLAFVKVKYFPRLKSNLFAPYFKYIVYNLTEIDCLFMDNQLAKLLVELTEVQTFKRLLQEFLDVDYLSQQIPSVLKSILLKSEVLKRFTKQHQRLVLISDHYSGQIEYLVWKKAKESQEIITYFKKNMPKVMFNTQRFLLYNKKITMQQMEAYLPFEKRNVIILSEDISILKTFKEIVEHPFERWDFLCYSRTSFLDSWIKSNTPHKIIIDYDFSTRTFKNGIDFLRIIIQKYPVFKDLMDDKSIYIIAKNNQLLELHEYKKRYEFSIITKPLIYKNIEDAFLYY